MHTLAYWGALFEQQRRARESRLFAATLTWELYKLADMEAAYYRVKRIMKEPNRQTFYI